MIIYSEKEIDKVAQGICDFLQKNRKKQEMIVLQEKKTTFRKKQSQSRNWSKWKKRK